MTEQVFAAVDIGASSGRVMAGIVSDTAKHGIELVEVHRFDNAPIELDGHLHWDVDRLWTQTLTGLRRLVERWPEVISIGIDTWAVDYGLLDADGALIGAPYSYRDSRTDEVIAAVHAAIPPQRLYEITGLQFLPFNTVYQLAAERRGPRWDRAACLLLLPDLLAERLTGQRVAEATNASTTGLLDATTGQWSAEVLAAIGVEESLLAPVIEPGTPIATVRPGLGLPAVPVVAVGSHDTASAVVGTPARTKNFAYVSSGTWSLVGQELAAPVLSEASRAANFTNEGGVDRTTRYLRNVGGLWLLEQCRQEWGQQWGGAATEIGELIEAAAALGPNGPTIDVDDPAFIAPGDMVARITAAVEASGRRAPADPAGITRCILDSLAQCYARTLAQAVELSGQPVEVVHIVGGGSQNALLCELTARATGLLVQAGPVEATALGNVAVQARTAGLVSGDLMDLRSLF
ncbi:MAG TPA: rhamnulokinase [Candidatus Avipropionibacterium avicola]|uniref:Rhamnulokinase n=1 Tax=Candidatus Avipropionibacterium avicola TaxID=2840701 RepID=A0A9D1H0Q3_9ACTN|nr:rhamnulokinase [Candidatus Avipropionibacterium avicola]